MAVITNCLGRPTSASIAAVERARFVDERALYHLSRRLYSDLHGLVCDTRGDAFRLLLGSDKCDRVVRCIFAACLDLLAHRPDATRAELGHARRRFRRSARETQRAGHHDTWERRVARESSRP